MREAAVHRYGLETIGRERRHCGGERGGLLVSEAQRRMEQGQSYLHARCAAARRPQDIAETYGQPLGALADVTMRELLKSNDDKVNDWEFKRCRAHIEEEMGVAEGCAAGEE